MYTENLEWTRAIVSSMNIGYLSDTVWTRTRNLFPPKCAPIPLGLIDGLYSSDSLYPKQTTFTHRNKKLNWNLCRKNIKKILNRSLTNFERSILWKRIFIEIAVGSETMEAGNGFQMRRTSRHVRKMVCVLYLEKGISRQNVCPLDAKAGIYSRLFCKGRILPLQKKRFLP